MATAFTSLADLVKSYESGTRGVAGTSNYTIVNKTSGASGAYQYLDSSWRQYATQAGVDVGQYPTAASAPPAVQDAVFQSTVQQVGLSPWTCPNCNDPLVAAIQGDPSLAQLPTTAGGATGTVPVVLGADQGTIGSNPGSFPGTGADGMPYTPPAGGGVMGWWGGMMELLTRFGVFTFGMLLVLLALFAMLWQSKTVQTSVRTVGATVK
jgi:hypothetical protein